MVNIFFLLFTFICSKNTIVQLPVEPEGPYYHFQTFENDDWDKHYVIVSDSKFKGTWRVEKSQVPPYENMIYTKTQNSLSAISSNFTSPLKLTNDTLVVQFEVRYEQPLQCGGAYIILYGEDNQNSSYVIKFGPDLCSPNNHVYFNFTHKNRLTGRFVEHRLIEPPIMNDITPGISHLYTLVIRSDNSFEILVDTISMLQGDLLIDFIPSVNPPKEIDDPNDKKPKDFNDQEMIFDKSVKKPADWEQPEFIPNPAKLNPPSGWLLNEPDRIPDPQAKKPADWDEEFFGKWEAPLIENPKCKIGCGKYTPPLMKNPKFKGVWRPPKIRNPDYQGKWVPRKIPNPKYYSDTNVHNFRPLAGLRIETKVVSSKVGFNNFLVSTNEAMVHQWNKKYYRTKTRFLKLQAKGKLQAENTIQLVRGIQKVPELQKVQIENNQNQFNTPRSENVNQENPMNDALNGFFATISNSWNSMNNSGKIFFISILVITILVPFIVCGCVLVVYLRRKGRNDEYSDYDYDYEEEVKVKEKPKQKEREVKSKPQNTSSKKTTTSKKRK